MKREDLDSTGLNAISDVWFIWAQTLPVVWHPNIGLSAILTPPDDLDHVICAAPPRQYLLVDLGDLEIVKQGTSVVLEDGRHGHIANFSPFASLFMFHDDESQESSMEATGSIVRLYNDPDTV